MLSSYLSLGHAVDEILQLQITYGLKPVAVSAPRSPAAERDPPYGFIPPDFVLKKPSAFWPEVLIWNCPS